MSVLIPVGDDIVAAPFIERREKRRIPVRRQLINVSLISTAIAIPFVASGRATMLLIIAALGFFIMFHEFAHFAVAKLCGMKVTEFFVGFGPRIFSFRRGETEYGIKAIPAGGYVKIIGMSTIEEVAEADEARTYRQSTWPRKFAAIVAGPASHFLVAFLLLVVMFAATGDLVGTKAKIVEVTAGSSAAEQGVRPGDVIVEVNGAPVKTYQEAIERFGKQAGIPINLTVERAGKPVKMVVERRPMVIDGAELYLIGIQSAADADSYIFATYPLGTSVRKATSELGRYTTGTVSGMASFFRPSSVTKLFKQVVGASSAKGPITRAELESRPTSVVGMVSIGSSAAKTHASDLIQILVMINLALGAFNLLPMLPLDGGHIMIASYEAVVSRVKGRRHHADMNKVLPFAAVFLAFILVLGLSAMYLDIVRPVS